MSASPRATAIRTLVSRMSGVPGRRSGCELAVNVGHHPGNPAGVSLVTLGLPQAAPVPVAGGFFRHRLVEGGRDRAGVASFDELLRVRAEMATVTSPTSPWSVAERLARQEPRRHKAIAAFRRTWSAPLINPATGAGLGRMAGRAMPARRDRPAAGLCSAWSPRLPRTPASVARSFPWDPAGKSHQ